MSGYEILTLVFPDAAAVPADPVARWPGPIGTRRSDGTYPGEIREYGVDGRTVGVWIRSPALDLLIEAVFETYGVEAVVVADCNDTSDVCAGAYYTDPGEPRDRTGDGECNYGRGLQADAEREWGVCPWTYWDWVEKMGLDRRP